MIFINIFPTLRSWKLIAKVWTDRRGKALVVLQRSQQGTEKRRFDSSTEGQLFESIIWISCGDVFRHKFLSGMKQAWTSVSQPWHFLKLSCHLILVLEVRANVRFTWGLRALWQLWQLVPQGRWVLVLWIQQENSLIVRIAVGEAWGKEKKIRKCLQTMHHYSSQHPNNERLKWGYFS